MIDLYIRTCCAAQYFLNCSCIIRITDSWRLTASDSMSSACYHIGTNRLSDEYQVTNIDVVNKRSNKNLFKTALEKLNKRYRNRRKINDNLYEVIVIYKENDVNTEDKIDDEVIVKSEPEPGRPLKGKGSAPTPPPRTRSRNG